MPGGRRARRGPGVIGTLQATEAVKPSSASASRWRAAAGLERSGDELLHREGPAQSAVPRLRRSSDDHGVSSIRRGRAFRKADGLLELTAEGWGDAWALPAGAAGTRGCGRPRGPGGAGRGGSCRCAARRRPRAVRDGPGGAVPRDRRDRPRRASRSAGSFHSHPDGPAAPSDIDLERAFWPGTAQPGYRGGTRSSSRFRNRDAPVVEGYVPAAGELRRGPDRRSLRKGGATMPITSGSRPPCSGSRGGSRT